MPSDGAVALTEDLDFPMTASDSTLLALAPRRAPPPPPVPAVLSAHLRAALARARRARGERVPPNARIPRVPPQGKPLPPPPPRPVVAVGAGIRLARRAAADRPAAW